MPQGLLGFFFFVGAGSENLRAQKLTLGTAWTVEVSMGVQ